VKELCDLHKKLFDSLQEKQQNTLAEAVSFSYITTLDLYLKSQQQNDIQNCIDTAIREDPRQVCRDFMESSNIFRLWDKNKQASVCLEAAASVHKKCEATPNCNPSAVFMANLYTNFVEFINDSYGSLYKTFDQELNRDLEEESQKITNEVALE